MQREVISAWHPSIAALFASGGSYDFEVPTDYEHM